MVDTSNLWEEGRGDDVMVDIDGEDFIFSIDVTAPSLPDFSSPTSPSYSPPSPSPSSSLASSFKLKSAEVVAPPPPPEDSAQSMWNLVGDFDMLEPCSPFYDDYTLIDESNISARVSEKDFSVEEHQLVGGGGEEISLNSSDDLGKVFLEWLKENKDAISPEDLRSIKLKRSTIECAVRRLGGGDEGMKKLLKLILHWVRNNHLHKTNQQQQQQQQLYAPPFGIQQPHFSNSLTISSPALPYCNSARNGTFMQFSPLLDPQNVEHQISSWPPSPAPSPREYGSNSGSSVGNSLTSRQSGITPGRCEAKEARKKRMARHRRFSSINANCI